MTTGTRRTGLPTRSDNCCRKALTFADPRGSCSSSLCVDKHGCTSIRRRHECHGWRVVGSATARTLGVAIHSRPSTWGKTLSSSRGVQPRHLFLMTCSSSWRGSILGTPARSRRDRCIGARSVRCTCARSSAVITPRLELSGRPTATPPQCALPRPGQLADHEVVRVLDHVGDHLIGQ
jgi:hypothetical protein